jgi:hypothetical protein
MMQGIPLGDTMPKINMKRGFNRIYVVFSVLAFLLCGAPAVDAQTQAGSLIFTTGPRFRCIRFLELERVAVSGREQVRVFSNQPDLTDDYFQALGWLKGFSDAHRQILMSWGALLGPRGEVGGDGGKTRDTYFLSSSLS